MRWVIVILFCLDGLFISAQRGMDSVLLIDNQSILFESGKWNLSDNDSLVLSEIIDRYKSLDKAWIHITGHTDADGSENYNLDLSQKRCETVSKYLVSQGIDSSAIRLESYGEYRPVDSNKTSIGKSRNRRVETSLYKKFKIWEIEGTIWSEDDSVYQENALIMLHSKYFRDTTFSDSEGKFKILSPMEQVIGIDVIAKNHFFMTTMLRSDEKSTENLRIEISKALPGRSISLEKFFFVGDRAIILEEYVSEIDNLEAFMKLSPDVCIEIIGHVNEPGRPPVDSSSFEYNLSVARSKLIYDKMISKGIPADRMLYTGKGNWDMLFPLAKTSEQMRKNRRVEILIRDCQITRLAKNDPLNDKFDFYSLPVKN